MAMPRGADGSSSTVFVNFAGDNDLSLERWLDANFPDNSNEEF
jgi:hypothetical protein